MGRKTVNISNGTINDIINDKINGTINSRSFCSLMPLLKYKKTVYQFQLINHIDSGK